MPLHVKGSDVLDGSNVLQVRGGAMATKMVYGNECNMMIATRGPGYHSNPHRHDCEQINYLIKGEVWVFCDGEAFLMKEGDFSRIPRNALHWAWNRSDSECILIEVHAPACDPTSRLNAMGLYKEGETPDLSSAVETYRTDDDPTEIERRIFGDAL